MRKCEAYYPCPGAGRDLRPRAAAAMDRAAALQAGDENPHRGRMGARNQVRRLPHACANRRRRCRAPDADRARLERQVSGDRRLDRRARMPPGLLDGELCAVLPDGTTSFAALQGHGDAPAGLVYFAFDLLHLDGEDLTRLPLLERKARLEALLSGAPAGIRFSSHVIGNGAQVFEAGAKLGVEGIVSKQVDKPYSRAIAAIWVKTKCLNRQEFVVVGWTDPEGSRPHLGALLLGYYTDDGKLIYAGRVGTGMPDKTLADLRRKLEPIGESSMPLAAPPPRKTRFGSPLVLSRVHWVEPELVAEITYLTWTGDGLLRHTVFIGLRTDKPAEQVRREIP